MSRYRGPKLRITRRLKTLPGLTTKQSKKTNPPGKAGKDPNNPIDTSRNTTSKKPTEYGIRLEEKQKLKFNYGLTERQLFRYVKEARRRKGVTGLILLQLLEMRLDTICFALGFGQSIAQARQFINHGHILVNQKVVSIPSFQCRVKDVIEVKPITASKRLVQTNLQNSRIRQIPTHLKLESSNAQATVLNYCDRDEILLQLNELFVIEHYSRR